MKFKNFLLLKEDRSKPISKEEAEKIINTKCKASLKGTPIYRGKRRTSPFNFGIIDPKKYVRTSADTLNYYTLLIDHILPEWKNYPKRSQSIICSTSPEYAKSYGSVYMVYPFDGSKIGVCPRGDIWSSFETFSGELDTFNIDLKMLGEANDIKLSETDPKLLKKQIQSLKRDVAYFNPYSKFFKEWVKNEKLDLLDLIEKAFDPKKNGFKLVKAGDKIPFDKEVWTDGKSILELI